MEARMATPGAQNTDELVYPLFSTVKLDGSTELALADNGGGLVGSSGKVAILQKYNPRP